MAKVRLQWKGSGTGQVAASHYKGAIDVIVRTLREEGLSGLFAGFSSQLVKSVLSAALMYMAKEKIAAILKVLLKRNNTH